MERVVCDDCKNEIDMDVKTKEHRDSIEEVYFDCPICNHRYVSYFTNQRIRKLQYRMQKETDGKKRRAIGRSVKDAMVKLTEKMAKECYTV